VINEPMDVLTRFPVRKTGQQKQLFRDAVCAYAKGLEYPVQVEEGRFGIRNVVIGDPDSAHYLITAHYDTPARLLIPNLSTPTNPVTFVLYQLLLMVYILLPAFIISFLLAIAVFFAGTAWWFTPEQGTELGTMVVLVWYFSLLVLMVLCLALVFVGPANRNNANDNTSGVVTLLEILRTLPENQRGKVCFVFFDLEEAGLLGSDSYRKAHPNSAKQLIINLDCVGDGDHIRMFPTKQLKTDRKALTSLYKGCGYFGKKDLLVQEKGFAFNPSDHIHFPRGIGIIALKKGKIGLYLDKIHTRKDTRLDQTNVNILRAALITLISSDAAQLERM